MTLHFMNMHLLTIAEIQSSPYTVVITEFLNHCQKIFTISDGWTSPACKEREMERKLELEYIDKFY